SKRHSAATNDDDDLPDSTAHVAASVGKKSKAMPAHSHDQEGEAVSAASDSNPDDDSGTATVAAAKAKSNHNESASVAAQTVADSQEELPPTAVSLSAAEEHHASLALAEVDKPPSSGGEHEFRSSDSPYAPLHLQVHAIAGMEGPLKVTAVVDPAP